MYRVFGTHKLVRIFSPSFRNVPFTGLEWSFKFKDEGYNCDGYAVKGKWQQDDIESPASNKSSKVTAKVDSSEEEISTVFSSAASTEHMSMASQLF